jgi:hypothetical protein
VYKNETVQNKIKYERSCVLMLLNSLVGHANFCGKAGMRMFRKLNFRIFLLFGVITVPVFRIFGEISKSCSHAWQSEEQSSYCVAI